VQPGEENTPADQQSAAKADSDSFLELEAHLQARHRAALRHYYQYQQMAHAYSNYLAYDYGDVEGGGHYELPYRINPLYNTAPPLHEMSE
jgi:hypothetical protein